MSYVGIAWKSWGVCVCVCVSACRLCVCVCVCVCVYVCARSLCVYGYARMYASMYVCKHVWMYGCTVCFVCSMYVFIYLADHTVKRWVRERRSGLFIPLLSAWTVANGNSKLCCKNKLMLARYAQKGKDGENQREKGQRGSDVSFDVTIWFSVLPLRSLPNTTHSHI